MKLTQLNLGFINDYGKQCFFSDLYKIKRFLNTEDEMMISNIIIYFDMAYKVGANMKIDHIELSDLLIKTEQRIKVINSSLNSEILNFLLFLIDHNNNYCNNIVRLAI